jgi:hypothetical protein
MDPPSSKRVYLAVWDILTRRRVLCDRRHFFSHWDPIPGAKGPAGITVNVRFGFNFALCTAANVAYGVVYRSAAATGNRSHCIRCLRQGPRCLFLARPPPKFSGASELRMIAPKACECRWCTERLWGCFSRTAPPEECQRRRCQNLCSCFHRL